MSVPRLPATCTCSPPLYITGSGVPLPPSSHIHTCTHTYTRTHTHSHTSQDGIAVLIEPISNKQHYFLQHQQQGTYQLKHQRASNRRYACVPHASENMTEIRCYEVEIEESEKAGSHWESNQGHLACTVGLSTSLFSPRKI